MSMRATALVRGAVFGGLSLSLAACGAEPPPPAVPPMSAPAPVALEAAPVAAAPARKSDAEDVGRTPEPAPPVIRNAAPTYVIGRIKGRSSDRLGRMLEPTQERVAACVPGTSGTVRVRLESKGDETILAIEPNVDLDVAARRCILEALSTMQLDDDPSKRLGPGGFTSHIVISW